jgi:hypothetical protein
MQYIQWNIVQYNIVKYGIEQYSVMLHNKAYYVIIQHW